MGYVCRCDGEHVTSRAGRRRVATGRSGRSTVRVGVGYLGYLADRNYSPRTVRANVPEGSVGGRRSVPGSATVCSKPTKPVRL